ncbi:MAG TPA: hypothetical protein VK765_03465 [Solirubrobacteraceae bacterium]|jgi:hypothetical protein|nr:hypothetical protein [Solirubrobacteraceae bacterium]
MRSVQLQEALTEFVEAASAELGAALAEGAEVRFELESQGARARGSVLYAYRALTSEFIAEHRTRLERLPSHAEAARQLDGHDGLDRYLASISAESPRGDRRRRVGVALLALLDDVFEEQTDFTVRPERLNGALERLFSSALAGAGETTLIATLHGLTIGSPELRLTPGLTIARAHVLEGLPEGALGAGRAEGPEHLVVVLHCGEGEPLEMIGRGRAVLKDLLRALRLFGDGRVTLGALAWARVGDGRWGALALGTGGRPHGMLVVTAEQEDELRAFCNLVSRRAPHGNELAWALRRFELGCERASAFEALSDHLLALRALLEPEGQASSLLPGRLSALCATPERRLALNERVLAALALERDVIVGTAAAHSERSQSAQQELARDMADHLRALLRDVICGHLDPNLVGIADELLLAVPAEVGADVGTTPAIATPGTAAVEQAASELSSAEQVLGHAAQPQEILDVFI